MSNLPIANIEIFKPLCPDCSGILVVVTRVDGQIELLDSEFAPEGIVHDGKLILKAEDVVVICESAHRLPLQLQITA